MGYILLIFSWSIFYSTHSLFASAKLKRILKAQWAGSQKWYRLFYTIFSTLLFMGILIQSLFIPVSKFLDQSDLMTYLGYMFATFGTILLVKSTKQIQLKQFLGISAQEKSPHLITTGLYARVRHPLYLGLVLIFLGYVLVSATYTALIHFSCLILYLPFGMYFEEKNLVDQFCKAYEEYQKKVPMIIPKWNKKRGPKPS